jgi:predicted dehydrogenase
VRLGLIGCGPQGTGDLSRCLKDPKAQAVALCDVDESRLDQAVKRIGGKLDTYKDFRHVLDRKDIDAVIVATPDHWHAIPALQALRSGKDVYLEKPVGHTIREGQLLVEAARRHGRIVEVTPREALQRSVCAGETGNRHLRHWPI